MRKHSKLFTMLLVLLITLFSCSTPKKLSTIEKRNAKITEFEEYNLYETEHLSVKIPKLWKSYLEPNTKEQIRHSPLDKKGKIDQSQYLWLAWFKSFDPDRTITKYVLQEERVFYKPGYKVSQNFVKSFKGNLGKGIQTELKLTSTSNGDDYKINHFYFPVENGVVEVRMVYKENVVLDEMKIALESIARK